MTRSLSRYGRMGAMAAALLCLGGAFIECRAVELKVAPFKVDVTPPEGSPLCMALVPPATGVDDPLSARGIVLMPADEKPVVLVAVDWVGIANSGLDAWRESIAAACETDKDRVCIHALHQHDAPGCDFLAEEIAASVGLPGQLFPVEYARDAIARVSQAAVEAKSRLEPVTHVGTGSALVTGVASTRRILGRDGKVEHVRYTACADAKVRAFPEGVIDPFVKLISFWNDDKPVAVLSYYATHPQSYYQTGKVSADFVGLGRDAAERGEDGALHIHFNGAGGNIGAGKFNDGAHENREILAERLATAMRDAWKSTAKQELAGHDFDWATRDVKLPLAFWYDDDAQRATLNDAAQPASARLRAVRDIAWATRVREGKGISVARLRLGPIDVLHLPGELFVEYQLAAQALRPESFVCTAAYGDYGPGYIGTAEAYFQEGYETGPGSRASRVSPRAQTVLLTAIQELLE